MVETNWNLDSCHAKSFVAKTLSICYYKTSHSSVSALTGTDNEFTEFNKFYKKNSDKLGSILSQLLW